MTTNEDEKHEVEDFKKNVSFESGQFAIVDAGILKSLKDKLSLDSVIFVATKQSVDNTFPFTVEARYDDATLRELVITPAPADEVEGDVEQMEESIQILGHEGNSVEKKLSKIGRIAGGANPKSADRSERNKRYRKEGQPGSADPKTKMTKGGSHIDQRIRQKVAVKGAARGNFGQGPETETESKRPNNDKIVECMELLSKAKDGLLTEEYLDSINHTKEIYSVLKDIRDNNRVRGNSFDLVYETIQTLDEHWHKNACQWVENIETLIEKGELDV